MIFKCNPEGFPEGLEYRIDVTMREDSLEYDIGIINQSSDAIKVEYLFFLLHSISLSSINNFVSRDSHHTNHYCLSPSSIYPCAFMIYPVVM
jgi:hypothetical protein